MSEYIARRLLLVVPTILGVTVIIFALMRFVPGDVVDVMIGSDVIMSQEERDILRRLYGLDQPITVQYLRWLGNVARGDFGTSLRTGQPVLDMVFSRVGVTAELAFLSILLAAIVSVPLGILAAIRRNGFLDLFSQLITVLGLSMPYFWIAALLLLITSLYLEWHPSLIWVSIFKAPFENLQQVLLPVLSLGAGMMAITMRITRSSMLEVLSMDYILTARAKGLKSGMFSPSML